MEPGRVYEVSGPMSLEALIGVPARPGAVGDVVLHVTRRSDGRTVPVEFALT